LIFDNCEEAELLSQWRPRTGNSHLLLTSRRANWPPSLGVQSRRLDVLSATESRCAAAQGIGRICPRVIPARNHFRKTNRCSSFDSRPFFFRFGFVQQIQTQPKSHAIFAMPICKQIQQRTGASI
jgi:hypothetical protein